MNVVALNIGSYTPWYAKQCVISFVNVVVQVCVADIRRIPVNQITRLIVWAWQIQHQPMKWNHRFSRPLERQELATEQDPSSRRDLQLDLANFVVVTCVFVLFLRTLHSWQ